MGTDVHPARSSAARQARRGTVHRGFVGADSNRGDPPPAPPLERRRPAGTPPPAFSTAPSTTLQLGDRVITDRNRMFGGGGGTMGTVGPRASTMICASFTISMRRF